MTARRCDILAIAFGGLQCPISAVGSPQHRDDKQHISCCCGMVTEKSQPGDGATILSISQHLSLARATSYLIYNSAVKPNPRAMSQLRFRCFRGERASMLHGSILRDFLNLCSSRLEGRISVLLVPQNRIVQQYHSTIFYLDSENGYLDKALISAPICSVSIDLAGPSLHWHISTSKCNQRPIPEHNPRTLAGDSACPRQSDNFPGSLNPRS